MPSAAANDALCSLYGYYYRWDLIGYVTEKYRVNDALYHTVALLAW